MSLEHGVLIELVRYQYTTDEYQEAMAQRARSARLHNFPNYACLA